MAQDDIADLLLEIVAEKTGYPVDMLELSMGLDADLGIDSIKRVEILSAIQERAPERPQAQPDDLSRFQTLGDVVAFLSEGGEAAVEAAPEPEQLMAAEDTSSALDIVERSAVVAKPLAAADRKVLKLDDKAEVWVYGDGSALSTGIVEQLGGRGVLARALTADEVGLLESPERLDGLVVVAPEACDDDFLAEALIVVQRCAPGLQAVAGDGTAILATVSRMDGAFGLATGGNAVSGGLAGLLKTAAREWPEVHCKAIDIASGFADFGGAAAVVEEVFLDGPIEVGLDQDARTVLELTAGPADDEKEGARLEAGDLVVISGGARGVTAEVAVALAEAEQVALLLLGRSPEPRDEPVWLASLQDEAAIKRALLEHGAEKMSPATLEKEYRAVAANREIRRTLERIRAVGGDVLYRSADVRDAAAVKDAVDEARRQFGPVRGVVHGAGVLADRHIEDKTREEFETVYGTKVDGLRAILAAVGTDELRAMALFSSSTGRFGRVGQVDYAMANEVLNKTAQEEARRRAGCRVVSINWGPWAGGMVTPSLRRVFESEGIGLIGLEAGARQLVTELRQTPGAAVEVVVLGGKEEAAPVEEDEELTVALELDLSVEAFPFLQSHVIGGKAVLPMAVVMEWLAHGALHGNPGLRFRGFDDVAVLKGVKLGAGETVKLRVLAGKARKADDAFVVRTELCGTDGNGRDVRYAHGTVVLATRFEAGEAAGWAALNEPFDGDAAELYGGDPLFHGSALKGIEAIEACSKEGITAVVKPSPKPAEWISSPLRSTWLASPMALDCSFQMMIVWTSRQHDAGSLPTGLRGYRQFKPVFPGKPLRVDIRVSEDTPHRCVAEVEFVEPESGELVARIGAYECVVDASLNDSFRQKRLSE